MYIHPLTQARVPAEQNNNKIPIIIITNSLTIPRIPRIFNFVASLRIKSSFRDSFDFVIDEFVFLYLLLKPIEKLCRGRDLNTTLLVKINLFSC